MGNTAKDEIYEAAQELDEVYERLCEAVGDARSIMERIDRLEGCSLVYQRAKGYWLAQLQMALNDDHSYLGSSTYSMLSTVNELAAKVHEEEDEPEDAGEDEAPK